jgi:hypothetical protein
MENDKEKTLLNKILAYEVPWCKTMSYFNPYIDPFTTHLTDRMPVYDGKAYIMYPQHNFVYDKLWIIQSQGLNGGKLEELFNYKQTVQQQTVQQQTVQQTDLVTYPIFIKPRWGHLSASSKNCFKISSAKELTPFVNYKEMMWSEFLAGKEGMTDYVLLKGNIVHQITYIYSEKQNGFTDEWKYISPASKPPVHITAWVEKHLQNFTGIVNVQYREEKIIEVGLRLARGGAYLLSTENKDLITNINNIFNHHFWDFSLQNKLSFKPFYVFKCFTRFPIIYLFPQHLLDYIVKKHTNKPFYEYYFEPAGKEGMVFLQFMDDDFDRGIETKNKIENWFNLSQIFFYFLFLILFLFLFLFLFLKIRHIPTFNLISLIIFIGVLWLTRFLNPMMANYNLYKAQKQSIFANI